jgi:hypothetical protein
VSELFNIYVPFVIQLWAFAGECDRHEIPARVCYMRVGGWAGGRTDMTKPIYACHNFANAAKNKVKLHSYFKL